jgi:hypothetical protein
MAGEVTLKFKKSHFLVLTLVLLVFSVSGVINLRDTLVNIESPVDMNNHKINNLGSPSAASDAATKDYVDSNSGSFSHTGYSDISGSRSSGTTYTSGSQTRLVTVITDSFNVANPVEAYVGGNLVYAEGSDQSNSEGYQTVQFYVPPNTNYRVEYGWNLEAWYEQDF